MFVAHFCATVSLILPMNRNILNFLTGRDLAWVSLVFFSFAIVLSLLLERSVFGIYILSQSSTQLFMTLRGGIFSRLNCLYIVNFCVLATETATIKSTI